MTNYEHFKEKIIYYAKNNGFTCDIHSMRYGEYTECCSDDCEECARRMLDWLFEEYKAPIKLSKTEYHILKGLEDKWKYIARNKKNGIKIHTTEPYKEDYIGSWSSYDRMDLPYEQLFKFIKWEDEEPYSIEELLKCEVVENE